MKRLLRGSVVLAVAVGFVSCSGDPTSDLREPAGILATPSTVFIDVGETKPVTASLVDDQGNQIAADYEITDVGPGITVVQDTAYLHTTAPGVKIDNQVLFQVTGGGIANSSFTLNAGGLSRVIPVRVTPATVEIAISNPTPAWGESITLTAPAGILFTDCLGSDVRRRACRHYREPLGRSDHADGITGSEHRRPGDDQPYDCEL